MNTEKLFSYEILQYKPERQDFPAYYPNKPHRLADFFREYIAYIRAGAPLPPSIFIGATISLAPMDGTDCKLAMFSIP